MSCFRRFGPLQRYAGQVLNKVEVQRFAVGEAGQVVPDEGASILVHALADKNFLSFTPRLPPNLPRPIADRAVAQLKMITC